jgi:hypothetical protein
VPAHPNLYPSSLWSRLISWISFPPILLLCLPSCHKPICICRMRCSSPFTPRVSRVWCLKGRRGQRLVEAPGDNRKVSGFGLLDWRDGWEGGRVAPGRTADVFCEQVRAAVARSKRRGRVALVITDTLRAHTAAGSLLVREPGSPS